MLPLSMSIRRQAVLDHIAAAIIQGRPEESAETDDLVVRLVTAVIQDDIEGTELTVDLGEEIGICLAADTDEYIMRCNFVCLAGFVDVNSDNCRIGVEKFFPHPQ
jgi:hypothetical protein